MQNPGRDTQVSIDFSPSVNIDGHDFRVHLLMPTKAIRMGAKLTKLIGEPFAGLARGDGDEEEFKKALPLAVRTLTQNLDQEETYAIISQLFQTVSTPDNKLLNVDTYFHGRLGLMFKLLVQVLEIQFTDFFLGAVESFKSLMARVEQKRLG